MLISGRRMFDSVPVLQIFLHLIVLLLAILLGRIAVTANAIYIGLAVGILFGSSLLFKPKVLIGTVLILGLLVTGVLPLWIPGIERLSWAVSLLGFLLWGVTFLERILQLKKEKNRVPLYIYIALTFFVYSLLVSIAQWYSASEFLGAVKRYFQVWGVMFALAWLAIQREDIQRLQQFIIFVALVQLPFALYELIIFVPLREALVYAQPSLIPIDVVVGTFEGNLFGGGSNVEMVTFQIIILSFLLSRWREKLLTTRRMLLVSSIVLTPLFLGETKIVVIFLPVMFLGLYGADVIHNPVKGLLAMTVGLILATLAGYVYVEFIIGIPLLDIIEDTLRYNVENVGYGSKYLNRTSVLTFWGEQNFGDIVHFLIGHGLGSAHSSGPEMMGHIAKQFAAYGIGLTAIAQMLWEVGLIGFILFSMIIIFAWFHASSLLKKTNEPSYRADLSAIRSAFPIVIIFLFYRTSLIEIMSFQLVFTLLLGYLAVLSQWVNMSQPFNGKKVSYR